MQKVIAKTRRTVAPVGIHRILAVLIALDAFMIVQPVLGRIGFLSRRDWFANALQIVDTSTLLVLWQLVTGVGLATMAIGLVLRARIAWVLSLLLLAAATAVSLYGDYRVHRLPGYTIALAMLLATCWRSFDRTSIAASSLFALLSVASLLIYAVFGTLYFGDGFQPPVHDLSTATYFSIVSMSTVGYGDIVPHSRTARLFTASVIVFGITVFATSISAIIGPAIGGNIKRIVKGGISNVTRKNHYLIVGATSVAQNVYEGLRRRGYAVTIIVPANVDHNYPAEADLIVGDATDHGTLERAGASSARAVLALRSDDAENAFIVLAIREISSSVQTIALVNHRRNLRRLQLLKPDVVFSPQQLAGELLASSLSNEMIDNEMVSHVLFGTAKTD